MTKFLMRLARKSIIGNLERQERKARALIAHYEHAIAEAQAGLNYAIRQQRDLEERLFWAEHGRVRSGRVVRPVRLHSVPTATQQSKGVEHGR